MGTAYGVTVPTVLRARNEEKDEIGEAVIHAPGQFGPRQSELAKEAAGNVRNILSSMKWFTCWNPITTRPSWGDSDGSCSCDHGQFYRANFKKKYRLPVACWRVWGIVTAFSGFLCVLDEPVLVLPQPLLSSSLRERARLLDVF